MSRGQRSAAGFRMLRVIRDRLGPEGTRIHSSSLMLVGEKLNLFLCWSPVSSVRLPEDDPEVSDVAFRSLRSAGSTVTGSGSLESQ